MTLSTNDTDSVCEDITSLIGAFKLFSGDGYDPNNQYVNVLLLPTLSFTSLYELMYNSAMVLITRNLFFQFEPFYL